MPLDLTGKPGGLDSLALASTFQDFSTATFRARAGGTEIGTASEVSSAFVRVQALSQILSSTPTTVKALLTIGDNRRSGVSIGDARRTNLTTGDN